MRIGIDGSRAFFKNRTGIEEYSYQVIKNLTEVLENRRVVLYIKDNQEVDFELPKNWQVKKIYWTLFWTQIGLSLEIFFHPVDVLFVPAHTVPFVHPKKTIVTIHGLEYEFCPQAYSWFERWYMRFFIKKSCKWASGIVSVSENTKRDLMKLYDVPEEKIAVVYEGYKKPETQSLKPETQNQNEGYGLWATRFGKYLLFVGRIEERKNVGNIVKAFELLKEKYEIPHKLVLAGKQGYGYEKIRYKIQDTRYKQDVIELGFISEEEKWELLKKAEVFVFPTQYEGFGIPILEAQSVGCPVVASNNSAIPEIASSKAKPSEHRRFSLPEFSAFLVDPESPEEIAAAAYEIISNPTFKKDLIEKGLENVKRFSWEKCAREVGEILKGK